MSSWIRLTKVIEKQKNLEFQGAFYGTIGFGTHNKRKTAHGFMRRKAVQEGCVLEMEKNLTKVRNCEVFMRTIRTVNGSYLLA